MADSVSAVVPQPTAELSQNPALISAPNNCIEIEGVAPRPFDAELWSRGAINLVPDIKAPLLAPLPGKFRNIYAPSVVETPQGWRIFYGGWDGISSGNDHVYSVMTPDFENFFQRGALINPGSFQHVCNVNAIALPDGSLSALCTAYPDAQGLNGIAAFDGLDTTVKAGPQDLVHLSGYPNRTPDFNGMNVLLFEDGFYRLYFGDFRNFNHVFRASSQDGKNYVYEGPVLASQHAVNDVKKFETPGGPVYLMALHNNSSQTWYSLSTDGVNFGPELPLIAAGSAAEKYIVALGWIAQGAQEDTGRRLLGLIYGAGSSSSLAANNIFVRWLQLKTVFVRDDGHRFPGTLSDGVTRQIIPLGSGNTVSGRLQVYAEDGQTLLCTTEHLVLHPGHGYQLRLYNMPDGLN